jgi:RimJ/RimL family protein N-acetyltransferase
MIDPANYDETEVLKNGATVRVRSIRPDDKIRLSEAFGNLEAESIYTRFFHHKKSLTEEELRAATEVDFENAVALVVTTGSGENETIIGGGRYAAFDISNKRQSAEVAFTVEEDFHGQGIASRLLRHLARIAREKGVSQFEAEVLPENKAMIAVFERSGLPIRKQFEGGALHVTLSLTSGNSL